MRELHSNRVKADEARAQEIALKMLSKPIKKIIALAEKLCEGVKKEKFTARGEPVIDPETGKQLIEIEYDSAMIRWWVDKFVPDAKQSIDVNSNGDLERVYIALAERTREERKMDAGTATAAAQEAGGNKLRGTFGTGASWR